MNSAADATVPDNSGFAKGGNKVNAMTLGII